MFNRVKDLIGGSRKTPETGERGLGLSAPAAVPPSVPPSAPAPAASAPAGREGDQETSWVADAFDALFAEERGDAPPQLRAGPYELSEREIDRVTTRVAERLTHGMLEETVARVVREVSERLVREEIARIRAGSGSRP